MSRPWIRPVRAALLIVALVSLCLPAVTSAKEKTSDEEYKNLAKAFKAGDYGLTLRYRFEFVTADAFTKDSKASTLRTTLWYKSAGFHNIRACLEFQDVSNLGLADQHNDSFNGQTDRPPIVDPPVTEINQVNLSYDGLRDTEFVFGRREIVLDDARFVGNVLWRQNFQ